MENYRKIYEDKCKIVIPKNYDIHHIDFNRNNNDIENLVMLPHELHTKYHELLTKYKTHLMFTPNLKLQGNLEYGIGINKYIISVQLPVIKEFLNTWYECIKYVDYRDYLLGKIPNIHNFEVNNDT